MTGCLLAVFQPRFFQFGNHSVMPRITYSESVIRRIGQERLSAASAWIAAISSMRLLVVSGSPPQSSRSAPL